jgi:hypothetical protein
MRPNAPTSPWECTCTCAHSLGTAPAPARIPRCWCNWVEASPSARLGNVAITLADFASAAFSGHGKATSRAYYCRFFCSWHMKLGAVIRLGRWPMVKQTISHLIRRHTLWIHPRRTFSPGQETFSLGWCYQSGLKGHPLVQLVLPTGTKSWRTFSLGWYQPELEDGF